MTDPGDLANTDSNVRSDLPDATKENINPERGTNDLDKTISQNEKEQGKIASQSPDPLDL